MLKTKSLKNVHLTKNIPHRLSAFVCGLLLVFLNMSAQAYDVDEVSGATNTTVPYDEAKLAWVASKFKVSDAAAQLAYKRQVSAALKGDIPVLPLSDLRDPKAATAQRRYWPIRG